MEQQLQQQQPTPAKPTKQPRPAPPPHPGVEVSNEVAAECTRRGEVFRMASSVEPKRHKPLILASQATDIVEQCIKSMLNSHISNVRARAAELPPVPKTAFVREMHGFEDAPFRVATSAAYLIQVPYEWNGLGNMVYELLPVKKAIRYRRQTYKVMHQVTFEYCRKYEKPTAMHEFVDEYRTTYQCFVSKFDLNDGIRGELRAVIQFNGWPRNEDFGIAEDDCEPHTQEFEWLMQVTMPMPPINKEPQPDVKVNLSLASDGFTRPRYVNVRILDGTLSRAQLVALFGRVAQRVAHDYYSMVIHRKKLTMTDMSPANAAESLATVEPGNIKLTDRSLQEQCSKLAITNVSTMLLSEMVRDRKMITIVTRLANGKIAPPPRKRKAEAEKTAAAQTAAAAKTSPERRTVDSNNDANNNDYDDEEDEEADALQIKRAKSEPSKLKLSELFTKPKQKLKPKKHKKSSSKAHAAQSTKQHTAPATVPVTVPATSDSNSDSEEEENEEREEERGDGYHSGRDSRCSSSSRSSAGSDSEAAQ